MYYAGLSLKVVGMASIGKILDRLMSGEIDKQHAVRKLMLNRNFEINKAIRKLNKEMNESY